MAGSGGWSLAQRRLHWWTAGLVVLGFGLGFGMVAVPMRALLLKFLLYQVHKTIGLIVAGLVMARLVLRHRRGRPAGDPGLTLAARRAAAVGQGVLYVLLGAVPLLGYLVACVAPAGVPTLFLGVINVPHMLASDAARYDRLGAAHLWLAILLLALAAGHAGMAVWHHRRGAGTLVAMRRGAAGRL